MKRILAIMLALLLVATCVPTAVFAADAEASETGIRIKYDLHGAMTELGVKWESSGADKTTRVPFTEINYDGTNGLMQFAGSSNGDWTNHSSLNWGVAYGIQMAGGQHIAFEVYVPKAGTYTMEMWCGNSAQTNSQTTVYMSRGTKTLSGDAKIGSFNNYEEGTVSSVTDASTQIAQLSKVVDTPRYIENIVIPEAGKYIFTFYSGKNYCTTGSFYLIENGTGTATSVAALSGSIDKTALSVNDRKNAQMSVSSLTMSDGTVVSDISGYEISYKSTNEAVATVDASGKVTAVGAGEAVIVAYTTDSYGATAAHYEKVTVVKEGISLDYNFAHAQATAPVKEWTNDTYNSANEASRAEILQKASFNNITYEKTLGFFQFVDTNIDKTGYALNDGAHDFTDTYYPGCGIRLYGDSYQICAGKYITFEIDVPVAGTYDTVMHFRSGSSNAAYNINARLYVSKDTATMYKTDEIGVFNVHKDAGDSIDLGSITFDAPGKYFVTVKGDGSSTSLHTMFRGVTFTNGDGNALIGGKISSTASEINVDNGETATVSASGYLSGTAIDTSANVGVTNATPATFTYSSSNEKIATVDAVSGVVTPISEGDVTITATANAEVANTLTTDITVTVNKPGEAVEDTTVNVYIDALTGGKVETSLSETVSEVVIGTRVEAEAIADEGYEFAYWTDTNGAVLSTNAKESFVININTSIKACFEAIPTEESKTATVYFYNGNGEALTSATVEKGKTFAELTKPTATLTGFEFDKWSIADDAVMSGIIRAVALFKDADKTYTIKVGDATVASKKYGESVTVESSAENFVCWKLGDKVMSYEKSFTFNVYGDITLTEIVGDAEEKLPVIVLDIKNGENFLTYSVPAGYTKLEAGILFSKSGKPSIGSFYSKATEKTGSGQFTAKPYGTTDTVAVGYIIFRDKDNNIRVMYSE